MSSPERYALWDAFLARWPLETVRNMKLEEYVQLSSKDTFTHWLDVKLRTLGALTGNPNFQFALFQLAAGEEKASNATWIYQGGYVWFKNYGPTLEAAFTTIRSRIVQIIEAVMARDLTPLDELYFPEQMMWKLAFLYQDRNNPLVLPIYQRNILDLHGDALEPGAPPGSLSLSVLHPRLIQAYKRYGDLFAIADALRQPNQNQEALPVTHWVIPLDDILLDEDARTEFLSRITVGPGNIPPGLLPSASGNLTVKVGDWLVFLAEHCIGAFGFVTDATLGAEAWKQYPLKLNWPDLIEPISPRALQAWEWEKLEALIPPLNRQGNQQGGGNPPTSPIVPAEIPVQPPDPAHNADIPPVESYWKIAPGHNAVHWTTWREQKYIAMGWALLGDLSDGDETAFWKRAEAAALQDPEHYNDTTARKVWQFRHIPVGARIVANHGFHTALGFGTVTGPYYFVEGTHYPHRLPVRWDDVRPREIDERAFFQTLLRLKKPKYELLLASPLRAQAEGSTGAPTEDEIKNGAGEKPLRSDPCIPQNIILYGPPGVGKTYHSIEKALELAGEEVPKDPAARRKLFGDLQKERRIEFITFHQSYGYEEFVEGLRPVLLKDNHSTASQGRASQGQDSHTGGSQVHYEMHQGVFKRIAMAALEEGLLLGSGDEAVQTALNLYQPGGHQFQFSADQPQYVLIIDEINRGNISKILGELITLLEPDKRLGNPGTELVLRLSSSPEHRFAVPPNLHILGTMNTADRSIALMDVALRRRFQFQEMLPDSSVIAQHLKDGNASEAFTAMVVDLFELLNARIRFLFDRDHQLGHAYFLKATDEQGLRTTLVDFVIPLLQEYFHGVWEKLCMVLGCPYDLRKGKARRETRADSQGTYRFPCIAIKPQNEIQVLGFDHRDYEDHVDFTVNDRLKKGRASDLELLQCFLDILDDEGFKKHKGLLDAPPEGASSAEPAGAPS